MELYNKIITQLQFFFKLMDDKEYYSLMNRSNSALIIAEIQKKAKQKKAQENAQIKKWEVQQGREDAEMLVEKKLEK